MMPLDHCTMQMVYTMPAIGCYQQQSRCAVSPDGTKELCQPLPCPSYLPPVQYVCRKDDGTEYIWQPETTKGAPAKADQP